MAAMPPPRLPDLTPAKAPTFDLPPYLSRRMPGGEGQVGLAVALVLGLVLGLALVTSHEGRSEKHASAPPVSGFRIRPRPMTCAQWHERLAHSVPGLTNTCGTLTGIDRDRFQRVMGRPTWIGQTVNRVVWCYVCADGEIRLVLERDALEHKDRLHGAILTREPGASEASGAPGNRT